MPISFSTFIYTLARNAAVHFGELPDPLTNERRPPDFDAVAHVIDLLAMLEEKTRGNLTAEERQFLEGLLYDLRMRFVEKKGESRIIHP